MAAAETVWLLGRVVGGARTLDDLEAPNRERLDEHRERSTNREQSLANLPMGPGACQAVISSEVLRCRTRCVRGLPRSAQVGFAQ